MREKQKTVTASNHSPGPTSPVGQNAAPANAPAHGHSFGQLPVLAPIQAAGKSDNGYARFMGDSGQKSGQAPKSSGYAPFLSGASGKESSASSSSSSSSKSSGYAPYLKKK